MNLPAHSKKIAIVGAGWAGLSAALVLAQSGAQVTLFERSPHAGGRAACAYPAGVKTPFALDNGQHVMIGAYAQVLALLTQLGVDTQAELLRVPAQWVVPGCMDIRLPRWFVAHPWAIKGAFKQLPLALGLLHDAWTHGGLSAGACAAWASLRMKLMTPKSSETVDAWLLRTGWSARHIRRLWQPLCAATLNTPSHRASAKTFARVVQDGLLAGPDAAAMLLPRGDLSALWVEPMVRRLQGLGGSVRLHCAVSHCELFAKQVSVDNEVFDHLLIATPPKDAWRLLAAHENRLNETFKHALKTLSQQANEPICTVHLFAHNIRLSDPVLILPDGEDALLNNAVIIDRSYLSAEQTGWFSVVISSSHAALAQQADTQTIVQRCLTRLQSVFTEHHWPSDSPSALIHAKQATFSCTPDAPRPSSNSGLGCVWLAGDYVQSPENYPATLEGAVRSGLRSAAQILNALEPHLG